MYPINIKKLRKDNKNLKKEVRGLKRAYKKQKHESSLYNSLFKEYYLNSTKELTVYLFREVASDPYGGDDYLLGIYKSVPTLEQCKEAIKDRFNLEDQEVKIKKMLNTPVEDGFGYYEYDEDDICECGYYIIKSVVLK